MSATPSQGTYNSVTGLWSVGTVTTAAPLTLLLTGTVVGASEVINTATITHSDQFDPDSSNNSAIAPDTPQQADLALAKSVSDPAPNVGDTIIYTVTLSNNGPAVATNVLVRDQFPSGVLFISATPSLGSYDSATGVWTVGTVGTSGPQTLLLEGKVVGPDPQVNNVTIAHSDQFDPDLGNNTATATATPQQADLVLEKVVNDPLPALGQIIIYTLTLSNNGPDRATNVDVTDMLPAGVSVVSELPSQGTYEPATGLWIVGTVNLGSPQTLVIQARIVSTLPQTNTATITHADQYDPAPTSNTDGVTVIVTSANAPTVTDLQRFGFHAQPTEFTLTFSSALDPATAQDRRNYTLRPVGPKGHVGEKIRIVSAVYSPLSQTVTLHPAHRVYLFRHYKLVVNGTAPSGLASPSGVLLDGSGHGIPGTNYVKIFGPKILAGPYPGFSAKLKNEKRHLKSDHTHSLTARLRSSDSASAAERERAHFAPATIERSHLTARAVDAILESLMFPNTNRDRNRMEHRS